MVKFENVDCVSLLIDCWLVGLSETPSTHF